jgi:hypothetical protein
MTTEPTIIPNSWTAFVKDGKSCLGFQEFPKGGKYWGTLTLITKPTEAELKAELKRLKISLPA